MKEILEKDLDWEDIKKRTHQLALMHPTWRLEEENQKEAINLKIIIVSEGLRELIRDRINKIIISEVV
jgi:hypothetical protein